MVRASKYYESLKGIILNEGLNKDLPTTWMFPFDLSEVKCLLLSVFNFQSNSLELLREKQQTTTTTIFIYPKFPKKT